MNPTDTDTTADGQPAMVQVDLATTQMFVGDPVLAALDEARDALLLDVLDSPEIVESDPAEWDLIGGSSHRSDFRHLVRAFRPLSS